MGVAGNIKTIIIKTIQTREKIEIGALCGET
jgi:hypothetical protein